MWNLNINVGIVSQQGEGKANMSKFNRTKWMDFKYILELNIKMGPKLPFVFKPFFSFPPSSSFLFSFFSFFFLFFFPYFLPKLRKLVFGGLAKGENALLPPKSFIFFSQPNNTKSHFLLYFILPSWHPPLNHPNQIGSKVLVL